MTWGGRYLEERGVVEPGEAKWSLGLTRVYRSQDREHAKETTEKLLEPDESRACRRNILELAGVVVVAGLAGADPHDLIVFGIKPYGEWGVLVIGTAVILAHVYWCILRYYHLKEDGKIEQNPAMSGTGTEYLRKTWKDFLFVRKGADLFSNWAAFLLTGLSWWYVASWIVVGSS